MPSYLRIKEACSFVWECVCFPFRLMMKILAGIYIFFYHAYKWFFIIAAITFLGSTCGVLIYGVIKIMIKDCIRRFHLG